MSRPARDITVRGVMRAVSRRVEPAAYEAVATLLRARPARAGISIDMAPEVNDAKAGQMVTVTPKGRERKPAPPGLHVSHEPLRAWIGEGRFIPIGRGEIAEKGGLYDADSQLIDASILRRNTGLDAITVARDELPETYERFDDPVIYAGFFTRHFGHFITESAGRLWYAIDVRPDLPIVVHGARQLDVPFINHYLTSLGIPRSRFLTVDVPTQFAEVHVPSQTWIEACTAHDRHLEQSGAIAQATLGDIPTLRDEPVYFSRLHLGRAQRGNYGERAVERAMRRHGVRIVYPEELDFAEQIRVINSHRTVVGLIGSAHHLSMFSLEPRHHVYLCEGPYSNCILLDGARGNQAHYVSCCRTVPSSRIRGARLIDVNFALAQLRELGVVGAHH